LTHTHTHAQAARTHAAHTLLALLLCCWRCYCVASAATVLHARRFGSVERSGGRLSRAAVQPDGRSGGGSEGEGQGTGWVSAPAGRNAPRADSRPPAVTHAVRPDGEILLLFLAVSMPVRFDSLGMGTRFDTHTHARSSSTHARGAHPASAATVLLQRCSAVALQHGAVGCSAQCRRSTRGSMRCRAAAVRSAV
jgi:hypothetical protein